LKRSFLVLQTCVLLLVLSFSSINPVVILIHGSFAKQNKWHKSEGDFRVELEKQASRLGENLIDFSWSGFPTYQKISQAAVDLCKVIIDYMQKEKIIIIGHSNGGNVANIASQILHDPIEEIIKKYSNITIEEMLSVSESIINEKHSNRTEPRSTRFDQTEYFNMKVKQLLEYQIKIKEIKNLLEIKSRSIPDNSNKSTWKINKLYLLGTPVDTSKYMPQMHVVKHVLNLYSKGDWIQTVLGFFKRTYPKHSRIANLEVSIKENETNSSSKSKKPSHAQMHHKLIARWILSIPEELKNETVGGFENFEFENGSIHFEENHGPYYLNKLGSWVRFCPKI
jgi:hypothetical protein